MNVTTIETDAEVAQQKYKEYIKAAKVRKGREYTALRKLYRAQAEGHKIIDIYKAFEDTGVGEDGRPKLAIVRADSRKAYFRKKDGGAGVFSRHDPTVWVDGNQEYKSNIELPAGTFPAWKVTGDSWQSIVEPDLVTNVPIIPADVFMPEKLEDVYILFEVDVWSVTASVRDPYLLQRINQNSFVVLAEWDVTDVEAIVMRGR